jgi:hypothetical protein
MKKLSCVLIILLLTFSLVSCKSEFSLNENKVSNQPKNISSLSSETASTKNNSASESNDAEKLSEGNYEETGKGAICIATPSGTSENGNIPVLFASSNEELVQIGISFRDFDGSKLSYIYIDKILNSKEQYADADATLSLSGKNLAIGKHEVDVVQFDTDKPDGNIVTYKSTFYEVKQK